MTREQVSILQDRLSDLMESEPRFQSEPLVLGVIGEVDSLALVPPPGLHKTVETPGLRLMSNADLPAWISRAARGWYWHPLDRTVTPGSWRDAQVEAMSPGVALDGGDVRLHNDHLGVHQLHYFTAPGCAVFSNWLPLLVEPAGARMTDRRAWVSILLLGFPTPGRSQFEEIKSLPPFASLLIRNGLTKIEYSDPIQGGDSRDAADVIEAIRHSLPDGKTGRAAYPLSGGWDSRLLIGLADKGRRKHETWTTTATSNSAPDTTDVDLARTVAGYLHTRHREVDPTHRRLSSAIDSNLARNHHSTWMHSWLEPFAARLRRHRRPVVDGLGAVWIKGFLQNPEDDSRGSETDLRRKLWERLGGRNADLDGVWSPELRALFAEVGFQDFDDIVRPFSATHTWQTLSILSTRTARAISLAPLRLFGPEIEVFVPLITTRTLTAAFSPEVYRQRGEAFAHGLITLADPVLAGIPSTNDAEVKARRRSLKPRFHPATVERLVTTIRRSEPALQLLAPALRRGMVDEDREPIVLQLSRPEVYRAVMATYAYASWAEAHPGLTRLVIE